MAERPENIKQLIQAIVDRNSLQTDFLKSSLLEIQAEEMADFEAYVDFALAGQLEIAYLAECYDLIVKDTLREQIYFQRHKKYRYSSFDEVASSVYFDDEYMRRYMHGLAITAYLWPNHRALHRYFLESLSSLPASTTGDYLEIGPGHGMYMMSAMRRSGFSQFHGIDISPTSVEMTRSLLGSDNFGEFGNYQVFEQDFLDGQLADESYSAVVMGEVVEHVEQPGVFLETINRISTDDAFIFLTTPINAPAIDHIFLFDSFESIETLVTDAGMVVKDSLMVPYPGLSVDESMAQTLPVNVALVLGK